MRILYVIPHMGLGGSETQLTELMLTMSLEHEVRLFEIQGGQSNELTMRLREAKISQHAGGIPVKPDQIKSRWINRYLTARTFVRLLCLGAWWRPRVIHGFLPAGNLFAAVAGRMLFIRLVVCSQRGLSNYATASWKIRLADRVSFRLAHMVTTNCDAIKRDLHERYGVDPKKVNVISNGVKFS